ncbi:MAG: MATE family efflux transporter, partial [Clostridiales bacterium]|nr:MATE family efflux transporter [Clostridiales bacterium]
GLAVILYLFLVIFKDPCIALFNKENDPLLAELAAEGFPIYFAGLFFASANIVFAGYFSAVEQPVKSMVVTIVRGCIAIIPLVLIFAKIMGMTGVWSAFPAAELIAVLIALFFVRKTNTGRRSPQNQPLS